MRFSTSSILLAASSLLGAALAHNIQLAAHGRECFHENLHKDDKMTVTFQVGDREFGSAGNLDVDFWVRCLLFPFSDTRSLLNRSQIQQEAMRLTRGLFLTEIILSQLSMMANTFTVSATSIGLRRAKTFPSTSTA
jgi:emp24/gp25L/p24 family/GOLD